jgi:hypothetical protein
MQVVNILLGITLLCERDFLLFKETKYNKSVQLLKYSYMIAFPGVKIN